MEFATNILSWKRCIQIEVSLTVFTLVKRQANGERLSRLEDQETRRLRSPTLRPIEKEPEVWFILYDFYMVYVILLFSYVNWHRVSTYRNGWRENGWFWFFFFLFFFFSLILFSDLFAWKKRRVWKKGSEGDEKGRSGKRDKETEPV